MIDYEAKQKMKKDKMPEIDPDEQAAEEHGVGKYISDHNVSRRLEWCNGALCCNQHFFSYIEVRA